MFSQKAEEHVKNAAKAVKTTMFKWKPDWEVAAEVSKPVPSFSSLLVPVGTKAMHAHHHCRRLHPQLHSCLR